MIKKYTPGPWEFDMNRDTHDCVIYQKGTVPNSSGYIDEGGVVGSSEWIWIEEADAHLISCAPELLEALEIVMDYINKSSTNAYIEQWKAWEMLCKIDIIGLIKRAKGE